MDERQQRLLDAASLILWRQVTQTESQPMPPRAPSYHVVLSMGQEVYDSRMRDSLRALMLMRAAVEGQAVVELPECTRPTRVESGSTDLVWDIRMQGLLAKAYGTTRDKCPYTAEAMRRQWEEGWDGFVAGR